MVGAEVDGAEPPLAIVAADHHGGPSRDEIEQVARSSELADAQPLIERARQELQRVQASLSQLKSGAAISA